MPIEGKWFAIRAEYASGGLSERASANQLIDRVPVLESWVNAYERLRPKTIAAVDRLDLLANIEGSNLRERAGKPLVIADQGTIELKDIHD
jgi:hypothetical protein